MKAFTLIELLVVRHHCDPRRAAPAGPDPRTGPRARNWEEADKVGWAAHDNPDYAWLWERTNGGIPWGEGAQ